MQITEHCSYAEITHNNHGIKNDPTPVQLTRITKLLTAVFEPVRVHFNKPITINSCFRNTALNTIVRGAANSQHCANDNGAAIDLDFNNVKENKELFDYIRANLTFDQLINEGDFSWVHVSFNEGHNRKEVLKMVLKNGEKTYLKA